MTLSLIRTLRFGNVQPCRTGISLVSGELRRETRFKTYAQPNSIGILSRPHAQKMSEKNLLDQPHKRRSPSLNRPQKFMQAARKLVLRPERTLQTMCQYSTSSSHEISDKPYDRTSHSPLLLSPLPHSPYSLAPSPFHPSQLPTRTPLPQTSQIPRPANLTNPPRCSLHLPNRLADGRSNSHPH